MIQEIIPAERHPPYTLITRLIFIHLLVFTCAYLIYGLISGHSLIPLPESLLRYDALNYADINNKGYSYNESIGSNVAFFPGFPYLWRFTGLGIYGISILNLILFLSGFYLLCRQFAQNKTEILIYLSLAPIFFMYVPYSEALFFLCAALLLIGLIKRNNAMVIPALFLCCLCRSVATIFVPAIIIMELLAVDNNNRLKNIILYSLTAILGIFLVAWIQHNQTGQW